MKKTTFALLCFFLCVAHTAFAQQPKTDLQRINLKGKIKSIKASQYKAKDVFGTPAKDGLEEYSITTYNRAGNINEENFYKANGALYAKKVHKYNEKGLRTDLSHYTASGTLAAKYVCQYDAKGFLTEEKAYDENGKQTSRLTYRYDEKGNVIEQLAYSSDETKAPMSETSKYDEAGNIVERVYLMPAISQHKTTTALTYTANQDVAKLTQVREDIATKKVVYQSVFQFEYQLDAKNNWTSQTQFEGEGKIVRRVTEREITYYE
jgi:hypothetical protein